ncbi:unnamed protein product [Lactuca virosa]|uniref:DNA-directed RNA polymerase n=1 Tax=Lactuca virosa TaxID=75947 RepID=A0AAU9PUT0_9ASTR|nr:unnamed protein product [Lactuca virosa]
MTCTDHYNLRYPAILDGNSDLLAKRRRNRFIIPLESIQEGENQLIPSSETSPIVSLGQFLCENVCIAKKGPHLKSGQVLIVQVDSVVIRSGKPYLATPGATVHGHYGEILYEGDTLVAFIYEKSRSGDITQGLPKVEQVLEVRSIDSISMNLEKRIEGWNKSITRILGIPWAFLIGAELTIVKSRISLVNKFQKNHDLASPHQLALLDLIFLVVNRSGKNRLYNISQTFTHSPLSTALLGAKEVFHLLLAQIKVQKVKIYEKGRILEYCASNQGTGGSTLIKFRLVMLSGSCKEVSSRHPVCTWGHKIERAVEDMIHTNVEVIKPTYGAQVEKVELEIDVTREKEREIRS